MALPAFVQDIESVDESIRSEYKEVEGGFQLDVQSVNGLVLENVDALKSALGKERNSASSLQKEINKLKKDFDGVDPQELLTAKAALADLQTKYDELSSIDTEKEADKLADQKAKDLLAKKQKEWETLHKKEIGPRDSKIETLTNQLKDLMINSTAIKTLAENGAGDNTDLLLPHLLKNVKLADTEDGKFTVKVVDNEGNPRVRSDGKDMEISDLMPEFKEKWPAAFNIQVKPGGGTKPATKPGAGPTGEKTKDDKYKSGITQLLAGK